MDLTVAKDWLELVIRWMHFIFGAAWIGTSFYFNWLNHSMRPPARDDEDGVGGELWAVHGGEFFRVAKYETAPKALPKTLHWFKWEAYLTWVSGICLLAVVYYLGDGFLVDASSPFGVGGSAGICAAALAIAWLTYDGLCRAIGNRLVVVAIVGFALATGAAFFYDWLLAPRAAYIHVGAMLGTLMAVNVFMIIIPYQRKTVAAMQRGEKPDPKYIRVAAQRSLHNNYMTLPVLFIMVSNHYPFTFGHTYNWAMLAGISLIGAGVRHYFNLKNKGRNAVWILPVAAIAMMGLAFVSTPRSPFEDVAPPSLAEVRQIIERRCVTCHSASPTHAIYREAPQGVMFDTEAEIEQYAARINTQVVATRVMPLGNLTNMTDEERDMIGAWYYHRTARH